MKLRTIKTSMLAITCLLGSFYAAAEGADTVHLGTSDVSKDQIISILSPDSNTPLKTRGLRLHGEPSSAPAPTAEQNIAKALSLEVYFEFNSANLTPEAQQQLAPVGEALASNELSQLQFTLEGHTDASGDEYYNQSLSEQRAASVKSFFTQNYSVPAERVAATGKGESELLDGVSPTSGANRRVTIIAQ